tara:strand:- start:1133 stop:2263 length:1131 start_codon:yes stop_codon:yes gene_type:complete
MSNYKICKNCIMDTSDSKIRFDENGICDHCNNYYDHILPKWKTLNTDKLLKLADRIKKDSKNNDFDCIIGLSGGLDSSYTAYIAKEIMGLRPLLFHVDAGWNTQQAVSNIEKVVNGLDLDLYTEVINWREMRDLQLSFLYSQIPDQDLPQDYAFFSALYKFARKYKVKYVLTGSNFSTECCREPEEWGAYIGIDTKLVNSIHKKYGSNQLKTFPLIDVVKYRLIYRYFYGMKVVYPCNYVDFNKDDVENKLSKIWGWQKFKHKHHESRFTRFFEDYWLIKKFGYDKRRAHLSSLILTGQMKREDALERITKQEMSDEFHSKEFRYVSSKLEISESELRKIFNGENKTYKSYSNNKWLINLGKNFLIKTGIEKRNIR